MNNDIHDYEAEMILDRYSQRILDFLDGYLSWEDMTDDELEQIKDFNIE